MPPAYRQREIPGRDAMKKARQLIQCAYECRVLARELKDERERAMVLKWAEIASALAIERVQRSSRDADQKYS